jgi:hypothetical protein
MKAPIQPRFQFDATKLYNGGSGFYMSDREYTPYHSGTAKELSPQLYFSPRFSAAALAVGLVTTKSVSRNTAAQPCQAKNGVAKLRE